MSSAASNILQFPIWQEPAVQPVVPAPAPVAEPPVQPPAAAGMTINDLVHAYQTDPDAPYRKVRYSTRERHDQNLRRIVAKHGAVHLQSITGRAVLAWYRDWSGDEKKLAMGHAFVGHLRTLFNFGRSILEDAECRRLADAMSGMRFKSPPSRQHRITPQQVIDVRKAAHKMGYPSIALSGAFQFEGILRQKDMIGEWIPEHLDEEDSDVLDGKGWKWTRGARWEEIDQDLIFRHKTSKRQKPMAADLKLAPMVMEELLIIAPGLMADGKVHRHLLPARGPMIVCDYKIEKREPWIAGEFRRKFRVVASAVRLPPEIKSMDHRSGGITEAFEAEANPDLIRKSATHSSLTMTQKYNRGDQLASNAKVMEARVAARKPQS